MLPVSPSPLEPSASFHQKLRILPAKLTHRLRRMGNLFPYKNPRQILRLFSWFWHLNTIRFQEDLDPRELRGWTPTIVDSRRKAVIWLDLGQATFKDPSFSQTFVRFMQEHERTHAIMTDLECLTKLLHISPGPKPKGFIFHTSRCGSTLLANMLSRSFRNLVISEAPAINAILTASADKIPEDSRRELFRGAISALGQSCAAARENYLVKYSSLNVLQLPLIKKAYPGVPWIFLYRDPVEVLVSNMLAPSGWLSSKKNPSLARQLLGIDSASAQEIRRMSSAEFSARAVGNFCRAALQQADDDALMINYNQLSETCLRHILSFFQIDTSDEEVDAMSRAMQFYSKTAAAQMRYRGDSTEKQRLAEKELRELVDKHIAEAYHDLEQLKISA